MDADVLFRAATASHEYTAALVLLRMAEFTLMDAVTAAYAVEEAVRNMRKFLPAQETSLLRLVARSIRVVDDPGPDQLERFQEQAHWKDVINLAAASTASAHVLVTFNTRDYYPAAEAPRIMTPGELVAEAREALFRDFSRP